MQITFKGVTKRYGNTTAVSDLNLTIESGALHFLLGPSGCGKTTTLRMLAGLETVTEGKIFFGEKDVTNQPAAERGIGMVFQNYALWPHMTVLQNIEYGLKLRKLSPGEISARVDDVLEFSQLKNYVKRLPGQLSGGQQQRVALARALAIRPNVLLLDEPLSNLDAKLRLEMRDNITRIHKQTKITTVYVTHDQKEALSMGTEISVMHAGKLIQSDAPREIYRRPKTPFIAGFIGESNHIPGEIISISGNETRVKTGLGEFTSTFQNDSNFKVGEKVDVCIRPEHFSLFEKPGNQLKMKLSHLTYLGEQEQLQFSSSQHTIKCVHFNSTSNLKDGDEATVFIRPENVMVLRPDSDLGART